ncbi:MAG TPA: hypothetical protein VG929_07065 [Actinomycetota bacterium]|nr:hypothetical protein [Actinomycetota bacterium]
MLSVAYTLRTTRQDFAEAIRWHLAPFRRATTVQHSQPVDLFVTEEDLDAAPEAYTYFRGTRALYKHTDLGEVLREAIWDLHASVPQRARDFVFLHAGAVASEGRALLLPARMDCGKSSLTLALLGAGWDYLSDELAPIDPVTRRVYPFPKLISLDAGSLEFFPGVTQRLEDRRGLSAALPERYVRPEDVDAGTADKAPVAWLVFPTSDFGGPVRLTPVSTAAAVEGMAANALNLYRYGDRGVALLASVARDAAAFTISGGDPRARAEEITRQLSSVAAG